MTKRSDGREWLYVLEIDPGLRIKVGRTTNVHARLATHASNVEFGGGQITQVYTALCPGSAAAEFDLITRLAARRGAEVVQGREMFAGVQFRVAVQIAESIARESRQRLAPAAGAPDVGALLSDCAIAFGHDERLHLDALRTRLAKLKPERYEHLRVLTLGSALRDVGIRTRDIRDGSTVRKGLYASSLAVVRPAETRAAE